MHKSLVSSSPSSSQSPPSPAARQRMSSSSSSSSPVSEAAIKISNNDGLLMEILQYLPTKLLICRIQLVSKHFQSLIFDSSFSKLHARRHRLRPQPSFLLRLRTGTETQFFYCNPASKRLIPFHFRIPSVEILQCCNGLLLLEKEKTLSLSKDYYIYNPATTKYRKLLVDDKKQDDFFGLCLVSNPSESSPSGYQVIYFKKYVYSSMSGLREWFEVYDFETNTWKFGRETNGIRSPWADILCSGIHCNGAMYYIRHRSQSACFNPNNDQIHFFSQIPIIESQGAKVEHVMESNGHLHYIVVCWHKGKKFIHVYEMNEDDFSWFVKYRVDLNPTSDTFSGNSISVLGIIRGWKEEDSMLLLHVPGKIMLYRFSDEMFEVLVDFTKETYYQEGELQFGSKDSYQFMETLAAV